MITREDILKIAKLSKLSVEEDKVEQLIKDMSEMICFADTINSISEDDLISCSTLTSYTYNYDKLAIFKISSLVIISYSCNIIILLHTLSYVYAAMSRESNISIYS